MASDGVIRTMKVMQQECVNVLYHLLDVCLVYSGTGSGHGYCKTYSHQIIKCLFFISDWIVGYVPTQ